MVTSVEERFWPKVLVRGADECWEWQAATDRHGYGAISAAGPRRTLQAHRVSYEMATGVSPTGQQVLHRCDNPQCVNPKHLFLGTIADNMADMVAKGRTGQRRRLPGDEISAIRSASGSAREIARRFGVSIFSVRKHKKLAAQMQAGCAS